MKTSIECAKEDINCGKKTFKNECEACLDPEVANYSLGSCEGEKEI